VLRADGLVYQEIDDLLAVGKELNPSIATWDAACFDGHYVTGALRRCVLGVDGVWAGGKHEQGLCQVCMSHDARHLLTHTHAHARTHTHTHTHTRARARHPNSLSPPPVRRH
jgi:hypothetical protein